MFSWTLFFLSLFSNFYWSKDFVFSGWRGCDFSTKMVHLVVI